MRFLHFLWAIGSFLILATACEKEAPNEKVRALDEEINELSQLLTTYRIKEMNLEIQSQELMFEEWKDYASHLQEAEEDEHKYQKIEKQIQELKKQRDELLKKPA
jgi:cupin superfamily acireductone dioxygenase involved in methionine salvage